VLLGWAAVFAGLLIVLGFAALRYEPPPRTLSSETWKAQPEPVIISPETVEQETPPPGREPDEEPSGVSGIPLSALPPQPAPEGRGTLVFVIDDAGHNLEELEPFLRFPGPLTIAVLPGLPYSVETARRIRAAGKEVFLHQPMEALGGQDPGPGALYAGMDGKEIRAILERNLDEVGPVAGMNNHQGSKITRDKTAMETVLEICRERSVLFLDSKTIPDSAGSETAKRMGIAIAERDIFLDNVQTRESMRRYLREGLAAARARGSAVMIGHVWSPDLAAVLEESYSGLTDAGYVLVTVSRFMEKSQDPGAVPPAAAPSPEKSSPEEAPQ
jgi:polysaccharide deacetylase 2 family uncharacterized protein YibQ